MARRRAGRVVVPIDGWWLSLAERCVRDAEVGSSNLPHPTQKPRSEAIYRVASRQPQTSVSNQLALTRCPRECHKRFKADAWRLTVNAHDPVTGKRKPIYATVHAPNNKRGEAKADSELAKLIVQV